VRIVADTVNDREQPGNQGLQFFAVLGTAYNLAKTEGLGHSLPLEWFTQNIHN